MSELDLSKAIAAARRVGWEAEGDALMEPCMARSSDYLHDVEEHGPNPPEAFAALKAADAEAEARNVAVWRDVFAAALPHIFDALAEEQDDEAARKLSQMRMYDSPRYPMEVAALLKAEATSAQHLAEWFRERAAGLRS